METRLTPRIAAMIIGGLEQPVNRRRVGNGARAMKAYLEPDEIACLEKCTTNLRDRLLIRLLRVRSPLSI